jgi:hypothetical protein
MLIELLKVDLEFAIESVGRFAFRLPSDHAGGYEFIIFFVNYCFDRVIVGVISLLIPDILIYSLFVSIFFRPVRQIDRSSMLQTELFSVARLYFCSM